MKQKISIQEALSNPDAIFIDVRTPLEFSDGHIPGAINIPILSNEERVEIGTLYKRQGAELAKERGLTLVSPKFPAIFTEIKQKAKGKIPILYCARGGLRSQTVASVMGLTGLHVLVIDGGYKYYRHEVLNVLNASLPFKLVTLYGLTGAGKTALLLKMKQQGLPVIDLEGLACHRGSVFGQLGIAERQTQKGFEAFLYRDIQTFKEASHVFIEGESRRIGPVLLPQKWMSEMASGNKVMIKSSIEDRAERIRREYFLTNLETPDIFLPQFEAALLVIQRRLGGKLYKDVLTALQRENYLKVCHLLLENYYDRNYKHAATATESDYELALENGLAQDDQSVIDKLIAFFNITT